MSPRPTQPPAPAVIWYVYGIVPSDIASGLDGGDGRSELPIGLDDSGVIIERPEGERVAAIVSVLDGQEYAPAALEAKSADIEWLSPRAVAHDRVLTWASDRGGGAVVPLPMFSLFSGRDAVRAMLREREEQLASMLALVARGRELALRVYRVDAELLATITDLSPRLSGLAATAAAASPGQRYLLERKLESEKKAEVRSVTRRIVDRIVDALGRDAIQVVRSPIPRVAEGGGDTSGTAPGSRGTMVLNAAFLVADDRREGFQKTLTTLVAEDGEHGFRFDFTGPWPPYHFVGGAGESGNEGPGAGGVDD